MTTSSNPKSSLHLHLGASPSIDYRCPSCQFSGTTKIGPIPASDTFGGRIYSTALPSGDLYECQQCELQFRTPRLSKIQMDALYQSTVDGNWDSAGKERPDWAMAREFISGRKHPLKVLDVGCFSGQFLSSLGPHVEKFGVEMSKVAAEFAASNGVTIIENDYRKLEETNMQFDLITAFDVIEHVENPFRFLSILSEITKPNGAIIISTGDSQALPRRVLKNRHPYCAIAEHISFIKPSWAKWAAGKLELSILFSRRYCHSPTSTSQRFKGITTGLLYWQLPKLFYAIRRAGGGNLPITSRPTMEKYPPRWQGAKDHFITFFERNSL